MRVDFGVANFGPVQTGEGSAAAGAPLRSPRAADSSDRSAAAGDTLWGLPMKAIGGNLPFPIPDLTNLPGMPGLKVRFVVDAKGHIIVKSQMLGLLPVQVAIDPDAALEGKYGTGIQADMRNPASTQLTGDIKFHGVPVTLPSFDIGDTDLAKAFSLLSAKVVEPNRIKVEGSYRSGKDGMPFQAEIRSAKVAPGVYDFDLSHLRLGSWQIPVPGFLAAFCAWFLLKVLRGVEGVKLNGPGRLRIDLKAATDSAQRA
jgi:hypothetical protein